MPYICVLGDCPTPHTLFESGRDWLKHMRTEHATTAWTCMDDTHDETLFFYSSAAFEEHMQHSHADHFHSTELDEIVAVSYQRLPVDNILASCPFCAEVQSLDSSMGDILNHVAGHLFTFAQISLPWQMSGNDSTSEFSDAEIFNETSVGNHSRLEWLNEDRLLMPGLSGIALDDYSPENTSAAEAHSLWQGFDHPVSVHHAEISTESILHRSSPKGKGPLSGPQEGSFALSQDIGNTREEHNLIEHKEPPDMDAKHSRWLWGKFEKSLDYNH
ncbi:hypothetical protein BJX64DRAFT_292260 [Aspergillus heterothallicus]